MVQFDDGLAATQLPDSGAVTTDVLVVGSGPAGSVRPDKHIGWRVGALPDDPQSALREALSAILHRVSS